MDMKTYKAEGLRTVSNKFFGEKVDPQRFNEDTLDDLFALNAVIDAVKKGLYYGKGDAQDADVDPKGWDPVHKDLLHAALGLVTEGVEFLEKVVAPLSGKEAGDRAALISELGDTLWYANLACRPLRTDLGKVAEQNIIKLRQRFPDKFDAELAIEKDVDTEDALIAKGIEASYGFVIVHGEEATPTYFVAKPGKASWSHDANEALRFARSEDAFALASILMPGVTVRVTEHAFEV